MRIHHNIEKTVYIVFRPPLILLPISACFYCVTIKTQFDKLRPVEIFTSSDKSSRRSKFEQVRRVLGYPPFLSPYLAI